MMVFFFKQKTAYEMRISDWSSDVCSSDLQIAYANRISRLARAKGMPVIWSRVGYKADAGDAGVWGTRTDTPDSLQNIKYDSERPAYDPRCEIDPDDLQFTKRIPSPFFEPPPSSHLRSAERCLGKEFVS